MKQMRKLLQGTHTRKNKDIFRRIGNITHNVDYADIKCRIDKEKKSIEGHEGK